MYICGICKVQRDTMLEKNLLVYRNNPNII